MIAAAIWLRRRLNFHTDSKMAAKPDQGTESLFNKNSYTGASAMVKHLSGFNNKPKAIQGVQEYFQELTVTRQASDGLHRDKIYQFIGYCYRGGHMYNGNPRALQRFLGNEFWRGDREPQKPEKAMKAVAIFAMRAGSKQSRRDASVIGAILEHFYEEGVTPIPSVVAKRIKAEGGVDKLYRRICPKAKAKERALRDDLDLLNVNGLACDEGADAEEEEETDGLEGWSESLPGDDGSITVSGSSADDLTTSDQVFFAAGMLPRATDRQSRVFERVSEEDLSPRRRRKGRFNRNPDLSVGLDEKLSSNRDMARRRPRRPRVLTRGR
jgi:hypothetical protein